MLRHVLALTLLTLPAHAQWQLHDAHTTADLRGIDNVGHGVAWASGSDGTILRTEDAGFVWQLCAKPPNGEHLDFRAIQASDNNTAIIMSSGKGDLSRLYKTTDGCQTWKLVFTNPDKDGFWDAMSFEPLDQASPAARHQGILLGDPVDGRFAIFTSSDLGETWVRSRDLVAKASQGSSLFAASNSAAVALRDYGGLAFVTGGKAGAMLFRAQATGGAFDSFPSGVKFEKQDLKLTQAADSSGAFSIAARTLSAQASSFDFMVVGGNYSEPNMSAPSDFLPARNYCCFGAVPQKIVKSTTPPHGFRSAVAYDSKTKSWITVGPNGTDISTDDGRNWRPLHPDPKFNEPPDADQHWNALSLPYAVGPHGRIATLRPSALETTHP